MDKEALQTRAMWLVHDLVAASPDERSGIGKTALAELTDREKDYVTGNALMKMTEFFDGIRTQPTFDAEIDITLLGLALDLGPRPYSHPRGGTVDDD